MPEEKALWQLLKAIATADDTAIRAMLAACPELARASMDKGASRSVAADFYLNEIEHTFIQAIRLFTWQRQPIALRSCAS